MYDYEESQIEALEKKNQELRDLCSLDVDLSCKNFETELRSVSLNPKL